MAKTQKVLAENARLSEEVERLRQLLQGLPLGVYRIAPDGKVLLANAAVRTLTGEVSEQRLPLLCDLPQPAAQEDLAAGEDQGDTRIVEGAVQVQNGQYLYLRESLHPVRDANGNLDYYEGTVEDLTAQRKTEAALKVSEERYRSVVEHSPAGILLVDDQRRIIFANRETSRILGRDLKDIIGHPFTEFLHPDSTKIVLERYERRQQGESVPPRYEVRVRQADGTTRDIVLSAATYQNRAGLARTAAQILDITERTKAEQALRDYTEALEVRNAELDAFADSVAHDLKNPLSTIIGFAEALLEQLDTLATEDVSRVLRSISAMGRKMDGIIDELLIFSRIRRTAVQVGPVDMHAVIDSSLERLQRVIAERQAEISKPRTWPIALGHGPWIEEVWANYISNAIAYGGDPPKIELGADLLPDGKIRFWVRDNGDGISPSQQANLFDGLSDRTLSRGHGLGLSIVKRIVSKLGGDVDVVSSGKPGEGSIFSFTLPAAVVAREMATP